MRYHGKSISIVVKPAEELFLCDVQDAAITDSTLSIAGTDDWLLKGTSSDGCNFEASWDYNSSDEYPGTCELKLYHAKDGGGILFGPWRDKIRSGQWIIELTPVIVAGN